ncbi:MAG: hypothetical protein ACKOBB_00545, partial [Acidimicrobiaceae bacterium]
MGLTQLPLQLGQANQSRRVWFLFDSELPLEMVGWDVSVADAVISDALADELSKISGLGNFAMKIQRQVREFCRTETKLDGFDLPDPIAMAV